MQNKIIYWFMNEMLFKNKSSQIKKYASKRKSRWTLMKKWTHMEKFMFTDENVFTTNGYLNQKTMDSRSNANE